MALPVIARAIVSGGRAGVLTTLAVRALTRRGPVGAPGQVELTLQSNQRAEARKLEKVIRDHDTITARALNKAARMARTETRREIAQAKNLPQKVLNKRIRDYKASPRKKPIRASVWIGTKKPITARELKGSVSLTKGGNVRIGRRVYRGAFPARMPGGHRGIFTRKPGAKHRERPDGQRTQLPIEEALVQLLPEAEFISRRVAEKHIRETYPKELKRLAKLKLEQGRR